MAMSSVEAMVSLIVVEQFFKKIIFDFVEFIVCPNKEQKYERRCWIVRADLLLALAISVRSSAEKRCEKNGPLVLM